MYHLIHKIIHASHDKFMKGFSGRPLTCKRFVRLFVHENVARDMLHVISKPKMKIWNRYATSSSKASISPQHKHTKNQTNEDLRLQRILNAVFKLRSELCLQRCPKWYKTRSVALSMWFMWCAQNYRFNHSAKCTAESVYITNAGAYKRTVSTVSELM